MSNQELLQAIRAADTEAVRHLLAAGASANGEGKSGELPLLAAIRTRRVALVHLLLEAGADPLAADRRGATPLALATALGFEEALLLLRARGADAQSDPHLKSPDPFVRAVREGDIAAVRRELARGTSVDGRSPAFPWERPRAVPLVEAVRHGQPAVVAVLLEAGADPNRADSGGCTPLIAAVESNDPTMVTRLLDSGADPNLRVGRESATALQRAAYRGAIEVVQLLLEHGADPQSVLDKGVASLIRLRGPVLECLIHAGGKAPPEIANLLQQGNALP